MGGDHGGGGGHKKTKKICGICTFEGIGITVVGICAFGILVLCFNMVAREEKEEIEEMSKKLPTQQRTVARQERILAETFEYEVMTSPLDWSPHVNWAVISSHGGSSGESLCPVINTLTSRSWRVIFFSDRLLDCCRSPTCEQLSSSEVSELPLRTAKFTSGSDSLVKNIGFLLALSHEAQYILDVDVDSLSLTCNADQRYCEDLLSKDFDKLIGDEDRSLFLNPSFGRRMYNPMKHFGCPNCWPKGFIPPISSDPSNSYFVCKKKPPAMQVLLPYHPELDHHAPSITVPPGILAPASVTATMFGPHVLWGSLLLAQGSPLLRNILVQALMGAEEGGTRFHLSEFAALEAQPYLHDESPALWNKKTQLLTEMARWACPLPTKLNCLSLLTEELYDEGLVTETDIKMIEAWVFDISNMRNTTHHTKENTVYYRAPLSKVSKMCSNESITGVRFFPADPPIKLSNTYIEEWNGKLEEIKNSLQEYPHSQNSMEKQLNIDPFEREKREAEPVYGYSEYHRDVIRDLADEMCPKFGELIPPVTHQKIDKILLIVTFHHPMYSVLPDLEVIYRNRFSNILYCGPNDVSIEAVIHKHEEYEGRSLSFFPVKESSEFECLIGAIEMGYDVDGYLFSSWNSLLNPWVISSLPTEKMWSYTTLSDEVEGIPSEEDYRSLLDLLGHLVDSATCDKEIVEPKTPEVLVESQSETNEPKPIQNAHHHPYISKFASFDDDRISDSEFVNGSNEAVKDVSKRSIKKGLKKRTISKRSITIQQSAPLSTDSFATSYHKLMARVVLAKDTPSGCTSVSCEECSEFLDNLYENIGKYYNSTYPEPEIPVYYIPKMIEGSVLEFAKVFRDYHAIKKLDLFFLLSGMTNKENIVKLDGSKGNFEEFDSRAAVVHPVNLKEILTNPEINYLFCKQYLLTVMSS